MKVSTAIFKTYDIRGLYPNDLNTESATLIGKAFGTYIQSKYGKRIVVGSDNRNSSEPLRKAFIEGLLSTGCNVVDVGLTLTPVIKYLSFKEEFDSGVMITASHNPVNFNGFKFVSKRSLPIYGEELLKILDIANTGFFVLGSGKYTLDTSLNNVYKEHLTELFNFTHKSANILVDCGHATSSKLFPDLLKTFGFTHNTFLCNLDGNFPHGVPDPENKKFMSALSKNVVYGKYDLGIAFDTDSDRFGVVDSLGEIYKAEKLAMLFSEHILLENPGSTILYDVKSSAALEKHILAFGGVPKMLRVGSPFFLKEMKKSAIFGAERSGHFYFADRYLGFDDGLYAALRLLEILDLHKDSLANLTKKYPKTYHTDEIKLYLADDKKDFDLTMIASKLLEHPKVLDIDTTDGLRVRIDDWSFFLLRNSNTGPYISSIFEADTKEKVFEMFEIASKLMPQANFSNIEIYHS